MKVVLIYERSVLLVQMRSFSVVLLWGETVVPGKKPKCLTWGQLTVPCADESIEPGPQ